MKRTPQLFSRTPGVFLRRLVFLFCGLVFSFQTAHAQLFLSNADRIKAFKTALYSHNVADLKKIGTKAIIVGSDFIGLLCSIKEANPQDIEIVDYMIGMGANVDTPYDKLAPLAWAARLKKAELFEYLLKKGAKPDLADISGIPILHYLIEEWDTSTAMIETMLPAYKAIDAISKGETPVRLCIKLNRPQALALLLANGANPNLSVESGPSPLVYASQFYDTVSKTEKKPTRVECMRLLLESGAKANVFDRGKPLLLKMTDDGLSESAMLLLEHGADPNLGDGSTTPLIRAIQKNNYLLVPILLDHKADPNLGASDVPPVFMALWTSWGKLGLDSRIVMSLANHGADLTVKDKNGNTPYTIAWEAGDRAVSAYLAEHGAVDNDGIPIGEEATYHFAKAQTSVSDLMRFRRLFPQSPEEADIDQRITTLKAEVLAGFPFSIRTTLGGRIGECLADKWSFVAAAESTGSLDGSRSLDRMRAFLKGSTVTIIAGQAGSNIVIGLKASGFNRNLLVKSPNPARADYLATQDLFLLGSILSLYGTRIILDAKAFGYRGEYFVALERNGSSCIISFRQDGFPSGITFINAAGDEYSIQGEVGGTQVYYIPSPVDPATGAIRTSSLLYSFFESMPNKAQ